MRSEARSGASISNCAPRWRHSAGGTIRNASSKRPVMRKKQSAAPGQLEGGRSTLVRTSWFDSEYVKERFDLEASLKSRGNAPQEARIHVDRQSFMFCLPIRRAACADRNHEQQVLDWPRSGADRYNYREKCTFDTEIKEIPTGAFATRGLISVLLISFYLASRGYSARAATPGQLFSGSTASESDATVFERYAWDPYHAAEGVATASGRRPRPPAALPGNCRSSTYFKSVRIADIRSPSP